MENDMPLFQLWLHDTESRAYYKLLAQGQYELVPEVPGLYLWGSDRTVEGAEAVVPRYIGRARGALTLQKRLIDFRGRWSRGAGRYVPGPHSNRSAHPPQGLLAAYYNTQIKKVIGRISSERYAQDMKTILKIGLAAFPDQLVSNFSRKGPGSPGQLTRLYHAVDWALHGGMDLEYLWVSFLPNGDHQENQMIGAAKQWNRENSRPPMLNR